MNIIMLKGNPACIDEIAEDSCRLRIQRKSKYAFTVWEFPAADPRVRVTCAGNYS